MRNLPRASIDVAPAGAVIDVKALVLRYEDESGVRDARSDPDFDGFAVVPPAAGACRLRRDGEGRRDHSGANNGRFTHDLGLLTRILATLNAFAMLPVPKPLNDQGV